MGVISNIKMWLDNRKNKKLIESAVEETKAAEEDPNKDPLEVMLKIAKENPGVVKEFIQEIVGDKTISDRNVSGFLDHASIKNAREAIAGIRELEDTKIKGEYAAPIAKKINDIVEEVENNDKIEDIDYAKVDAAIEVIEDSNMTKKQQSGVQKQREEFDAKRARRIEEELNNLYIMDLAKINENELASRIKQSISDKGFDEIPEKFRNKINKIIAKKKAADFKKYGSMILREGIWKITTEEMLKGDWPNIIEKEYNQINEPSKYDKKEYIETVYGTSKFKIAIIEIMMDKVAENIVHKKEKKIESYIKYIKENNPDITEEEIDQIENRFIDKIEQIAEVEDKKVNKENLQRRLREKTIKEEKIEEINKILENFSNEEVEEIHETVNILNELSDEDRKKVNEILSNSFKKQRLNKKNKDNLQKTEGEQK